MKPLIVVCVALLQTISAMMDAKSRVEIVVVHFKAKPSILYIIYNLISLIVHIPTCK